MTIEIVGGYPPIPRIVSGFYSLDRAFTNSDGDIGIPVGHGYEIFGLSGIGKSSFAYGFAGLIASHYSKDIVLCDFEGFDPNYVEKLLSVVGFSGKVNALRDEDDEKQLTKMVSLLKEDDYGVGIIDSVGAVSPIAERKAELGEAVMGRRAYLMNQLARRCMHLFRFRDNENPKTLLLINHWYPKVGGTKYEYITPGGEGKKFLASIRVLLRRKEKYPDGSYLLEGEVRKNRWGYEKRKFYVFMLAGFGIHKGLTAVMDGVILGSVTKKNVIKIGDESMGRFSVLVKEAKKGNQEIFEPFYEVLNGDNKNTGIEPDGDEPSEDTEVQD